MDTFLLCYSRNDILDILKNTPIILLRGGVRVIAERETLIWALHAISHDSASDFKIVFHIQTWNIILAGAANCREAYDARNPFMGWGADVSLGDSSRLFAKIQPDVTPVEPFPAFTYADEDDCDESTYVTDADLFPVMI
jgi:hypothetical protein